MRAVRALAARAMVVAVGSLIAMAGVPSVEATAGVTLYVNNQAPCNDTTGNPNYCTIKKAVTVANPGDTVQVAAGTYNAKVFVNRVGTELLPITITTSEGAVVTSTTQGFQLSGPAAWIIINGFTINATTSEGIKCTLCSNVTLSNNRINNSNSTGITVNTSSNTTLSGNQIDNSRLTGIEVNGSNNITISGGFVKRSGEPVSGQNYKGIKFDNSSTSLITGVEVYNNSDTGVYLLNNTTNVRVKGVTAHHNARQYVNEAAGIEARSPGNIIESNIVYENEDSGINMRWGGHNALMINNIAYNNGDHGIDVLQSTSPTIVNNSIYNNWSAGINVEGSSTNALLMNNISMDNGKQVTPAPPTYGNIRVTTSSMPATSNFNIVYASAGYYVYHWNGVYFKKLSALRSANPGVELNGLQTNPNWVAPGAGNLHLTSGSAAIDSANADAISSSEIDRDAEGNARCNNPNTTNTGTGSNTYTDRGALEFIAGGC